MSTVLGTVAGIATIGTGTGALLLGFVKPWLSCPEIDDGSAACPADFASNATILGGMLMVALGIVVLVLTAQRRNRFRGFKGHPG